MKKPVVGLLLLLLAGLTACSLPATPSEPVVIITPPKSTQTIILSTGPDTSIVELRDFGDMSGSVRDLTISSNGSIVYIKEEGLRMRFPPATGTRITYTGQLTEAELNNLLQLIDACQFDATGNIDAFTKTIDAGVLSKTYFFGRTKTITSNIQPLLSPLAIQVKDVPEPVIKLFYKLSDIAEHRTTEISTEKIY